MYSNDGGRMEQIWRDCPCTGDCAWKEPDAYCWDCDGAGGWYEWIEAEDW